MAITEDDRKFISSKLVFALTGFFVAILATALIGAYVLSRAFAPKGAQAPAPGPVHAVAAAGLDTPVVLVGGSMTFKAGAYQNPQAWSTDTANKEYHVSPAYQVSTIVLKAILLPDNDTTGSGDANPTTDKIRIDVSTASTWEIDEFTLASPSKAVVKIFPKQNGSITEIHLLLLDGNGMLCPVNAANMIRIRYSPTPSCPAPAPSPSGTPPTAPVFSQVSVILNNEVGPDGTTPQPTATLNCIDSAGDPVGKCRISFRGSN